MENKEDYQKEFSIYIGSIENQLIKSINTHPERGMLARRTAMSPDEVRGIFPCNDEKNIINLKTRDGGKRAKNLVI